MRLFAPLTRAVGVAAVAASLLMLARAPDSALAQGKAQGKAAQSKFEGSWSVLIITERGECDRAYRYGIRIQNGQIVYGGEAGVSFTGRVESNGRVTAAVSRGQQQATGVGRLSGDGGAGTWQGRSNTGACGGRWEAERR